VARTDDRRARVSATYATGETLYDGELKHRTSEAPQLELARYDAPSSPLQLVHLRSPDALRQWAPAVGEMLVRLGQSEDVTLSPAYYLLTLPPSRGVDVLVFSNDTTLQAVLYGQRRQVGIWRTGFVTGGDAVGCGCLVGEPAALARVLRLAAAYYLAAGVHAVRWKLALSAGTVGLPDSVAPKGIRQRWLESAAPGDRLLLPPSYAAFLYRLSKLTRRNLRYYRRQAEAAGYRFEAGIAFPEYAHCIRQLRSRLRYPVPEWRLDQQVALLHHFGDGLCAGMRNRQGDLQALLCGFGADQRFHLVARATSVNEARSSLGLVLCGYLIEHLIAQGYSELRFLHGALFPLRRQCLAQTLLALHLDRPNLLWTPLKWVCGRAVHAAPRICGHWAGDLERIAGSYSCPPASDAMG